MSYTYNFKVELRHALCNRMEFCTEQLKKAIDWDPTEDGDLKAYWFQCYNDTDQALLEFYDKLEGVK